LNRIIRFSTFEFNYFEGGLPKGISLSAGFNAGKSDEKGGKTLDTVLSSPNKIDQHASTTTGVSKSVGFGLDSDKNSSVTKSGINTSNITIRDEQGQQALTGKTAEQIKSDILTSVTTDIARENSGALINNFDKDKVQSEINLQMDVTKNFDANRQEAKVEINKKIDDAKKENQSVIDKQKEKIPLTAQEQVQLKAYNDKVENYQKLGVLLDSVATGLSVPTSSGLGIATATLSPTVSYNIGQYFKEQASKNVDGKLTSGQETAHILAHTVLGAAVAAAGGNDALTAGLSAGGAEAAAPKLAQYLYSKEAKDLTAEEKSTISAITGLVASGVGATTGDIRSTVQSGQVAQNAVEDNLYAILTTDGKKYDSKKNTEYLKALQSCTQAQCVNMVLTNNAKDAMKNAQQILILNGTNYKEGDIIGAGLQYLVVNENGVLKAKILPLNYQIINSIRELETGQSITQGGALAAPLANLVKGLHDSTTGTSLLTNQQLSMVDRAFAALDAAGSFGMITGAFLPKGVKTTGSSKTIEENNIYRDSDSWSNKPSGKPEYNPLIGSDLEKNISLHNTQIGKRNSQGSIQGSHNANSFDKALDQSGAVLIGDPISSTAYPGLKTYNYQTPGVYANGPNVGMRDGTYKEKVQQKTVYDPKVISDKQMLDMQMEAAMKGASLFSKMSSNASKNRTVDVNVNGYYFTVTRDAKTGKVSNAFPIIPNVPKPKIPPTYK